MLIGILAFLLGALLGFAPVPWPARLLAPALPLVFWVVYLLDTKDDIPFGGEPKQTGLALSVAAVSAVVGAAGVFFGLLLRALTEPDDDGVPEHDKPGGNGDSVGVR